MPLTVLCTSLPMRAALRSCARPVVPDYDTPTGHMGERANDARGPCEGSFLANGATCGFIILFKTLTLLVSRALAVWVAAAPSGTYFD